MYLLTHVFDELIDSYVNNNIGVANDFLSISLTEELRIHLTSLIEDNKLRLAKIGNNSMVTIDTSIRKDAIYWLDRKHNNISENKFLDLIDEYVLHLNRTCFTGITSYEFHFAHFDKGSFYKKHLDQFQNNNLRQFSMICYLNENWEIGDGGELCAYFEDKKILIEPINGRSVFFKSDTIEHEVLVSNTDRLSVTGWFKINDLGL